MISKDIKTKSGYVYSIYYANNGDGSNMHEGLLLHKQTLLQGVKKNHQGVTVVVKITKK